MLNDITAERRNFDFEMDLKQTRLGHESIDDSLNLTWIT
jgi:hypothetical protein